MERKERDFSNSVTTVAKELLGFLGPNLTKKSIEARLYPIQNHIEDYLPVLRTSLEEANRTRENDSSYPYFAVKGITELAEKRSGTVYSSDAVSWTVAFAILTKDPSLAKISESNLRLLLDLSLGFAVNDYNSRNEQALRAVAYYDYKDSQKAADDHKRRADHYISLQAKLREKVSISPNSQKK